jgi:preprotein translocase YajC subunit
MTPTPALVHFVVAASSSKSSSSSSGLLTLLPLLAIGVLGYFFFIRPQQRKAQAARQAQGSGIEVGDEVQTVGGVIGTVLEVHGDRYTLLTGALGDDGNLDGPQPTRIVFLRQAIAKKIDRIEDVRDVQVDDVSDEDEAPSTNGSNGAASTSTNGNASPAGASADSSDSRSQDTRSADDVPGSVSHGSDDIDDVGGDIGGDLHGGIGGDIGGDIASSRGDRGRESEEG